MITFSIIIPVYNAEKTIRRCLDSILEQTYTEYEVLIMDDGSADESLLICKEYQQKDERFKVFHQNNCGPSVARNRCLDIANGEWICFVDSDDFVSKDYLSKINQIRIAEDSEVVFIGYRQLDLQMKKISEKLPNSISDDKYRFLFELSKQDLFGYTWAKAIKKSCIGNARFNESLNLFEDEVFTCNVLKQINHISALQEPIYNYLVGNVNALTSKLHLDYCEKCDLVFGAWSELLDECADRDSLLQEKANTYVERCKYYGFEHTVDIYDFFLALFRTKYFALSSIKNEFTYCVSNQMYKKIDLMKKKYILKNRISSLIRKGM